MYFSNFLHRFFAAEFRTCFSEWFQLCWCPPLLVNPRRHVFYCMNIGVCVVSPFSESLFFPWNNIRPLLKLRVFFELEVDYFSCFWVIELLIYVYYIAACILVTLWLRFGCIWASFGSPGLSLGSLWHPLLAPFGFLSAAFSSLFAPFGRRFALLCSCARPFGLFWGPPGAFWEALWAPRVQMAAKMQPKLPRRYQNAPKIISQTASILGASWRSFYIILRFWNRFVLSFGSNIGSNL